MTAWKLLAEDLWVLNGFGKLRSVGLPIKFSASGDAPYHRAPSLLQGFCRMCPDSFTHFDAQGHAHMVDVGDKPPTRRVARAEGCIHMQAATLALITSGQAAKGDVLGVARIAAIQGAKRTSELIPLCHPLALSHVSVDFEIEATSSDIRCTVQAETRGPTGVEMEALTAVQVGLLTIYDMCKSVDRGMVMGGIRLLEKRGGKSGDWLGSEVAASALLSGSPRS